MWTCLQPRYLERESNFLFLFVCNLWENNVLCRELLYFIYVRARSKSDCTKRSCFLILIYYIDILCLTLEKKIKLFSLSSWSLCVFQFRMTYFLGFLSVQTITENWENLPTRNDGRFTVLLLTHPFGLAGHEITDESSSVTYIKISMQL